MLVRISLEQLEPFILISFNTMNVILFFFLCNCNTFILFKCEAW